MSNDDLINTLNELIRISHDGAEGFKACAENARIDSIQLKTILLERRRDCVQAAEELSAVVHNLGGIPAGGTSICGILHRGWLNVKAAIAEKNDVAVLEECSRGEEVAIGAYQKALAKKMPESIRLRVEHQYLGVLKNRNLIAELREKTECADS